MKSLKSTLPFLVRLNCYKIRQIGSFRKLLSTEKLCLQIDLLLRREQIVYKQMEGVFQNDSSLAEQTLVHFYQFQESHFLSLLNDKKKDISSEINNSKIKKYL